MNDQPASRGLTRRQALFTAAAGASAPLVLGTATPARADGVGPILEGRPRFHPSPEIHAMLGEINGANIERSISKLVSFGTRNTLSSQDDPTRGIGAARDWLFAEFQKIAATSGGRMTVALQSYLQPVAPRIPTPTVITNVVATLRGSKAEQAGRTYVVSGHYDSMPRVVTDALSDAPGANDDGSGTAAVLEMARAMVAHEFDATIVFMCVAGEEQGLLGANHFAEQARLTSMNIAGMFTNDIIGSSVGAGDERNPFSVRLFAEGLPNVANPAIENDWRRFGGGETESISRQLARYIKEVAENEATQMRVDIMYRRDRLGRGGDHIPFLDRGWAAVRFTEPVEDPRHQHADVTVVDGVRIGDLPEFCDFDYCARVAKVNAAALAALARSPAVPTGVTINTAGLRTDTVLRWNAGTESDLAGYEVVMRPTSALEWEDTIEVGMVTNVTLPNTSKDNHFFGIRAVDRDGNRSPVAFPRPA